MTNKIKILFLGASPTDTSPLRLSEEVREIEGDIQAVAQRDAFELDAQWAVRPADLQRALLRFQPHVVHFSGHGSRSGEIILEDNDGKSRPVSKQVLISLFKVLKDKVRIIVLDACYSLPQAEALSEVIDYTVGMSQAVKDESAVAFAAAFYRALAYGRSVQQAFELAKLQIDLQGLSGADVPVLMVREGVDSSEPFLGQKEKPHGAETENSLTTLANIFNQLVGETASDEDRRLFRRAIFEGKVIFAPSEGEASGLATAPKLTRYDDRLLIELSSELYRELQGQLYPPLHGLPPPLPGSIFLGREKDLFNVKQLLGVNATAPTASNITIVRGWPGVGKTAFISVLCRDPEVAQAFPDGVLWTYLGQEPDLFSKLEAWGRQLTGTDELLRVPTLNEAAARLAELLRRRRMLLVVDDVWKAEHAVPFIQASYNSQCALLMTTRLPSVADELTIDSQQIYALPVLTEENALMLLRHLIPAIVEQHPNLCRELVHDLEYLPLSLHVAGRLLRREAEMGFDVVESIGEIRAGALMKEAAPPDRVESGSRPSLQALLQRSTDRLDEQARDCFAYLGAFAPTPATFDLAAMQAVWQVPDAKPIVKKLVGHGLLEPVGGGRFQMSALAVQHARTLLTDDVGSLLIDGVSRSLQDEQETAVRFFIQAGFKLTRVPGAGFYRCELISGHLKNLLPSSMSYIQIVSGQELDDDLVQAIRNQVKEVDIKASVAFAITDNRPTDLGWTQINVFRGKKDPFIILPIESRVISEGLAKNKARKLLHKEVEKRLGSYDPYNERAAINRAFDFFGRESLIETLLRQLAAGQPVGLFGLRKLGKSSLLNFLRDRAQFPVAHLNLQKSYTLENLYWRVLESWRDDARRLYGIDWNLMFNLSDDPTNSFIAATRKLFGQVRQKKEEARLGVFFDEVNVIVPRPDGRGPNLERYLALFRTLRGLMEEDGCLALLVSDLNPAINRINSWKGEQNPAFSLFQEEFLPPLLPEDCRQMLSNLGRQVELEYQLESLELINELSGGHPFLARQLCSLLYKQRKAQPGTIDVAEVSAGATRFIYDDSTVINLDENIWKDAGNAALWRKEGAKANQDILLDLARADGPLSQAQLLTRPNADTRTASLINLDRYHIIYQPEPDSYALRFGLLRQWLRQRKLGLGGK